MHGCLEFRSSVGNMLLKHLLGVDKLTFDGFEIRNIGVGRNESAVWHWLAANLNNLATQKRTFITVRGSAAQVIQTLGNFLFDVPIAESSLLRVVTNQVADGFAHVDHAFRKVHQFNVAAIPPNQALRCIDHADALRNILERGFCQLPVETYRL